MKCLDCGTEMEHGSVEGIGQGGGHWYEFTSDEEKRNRNQRLLHQENHQRCILCFRLSRLALSALQKILMWMNAKEP